MARLINADALKELITEDIQNGGSDIDFDRGFECGLKEAIEFIDNAPTVDVKPFATVTFDKDELEQIVRDRVIEPIKKGELVVRIEARPQGEWLNHNSYFKRCSLCNKVVGFDYIEQEGERFKYCPNCGADMRKEVEND